MRDWYDAIMADNVTEWWEKNKQDKNVWNRTLIGITIREIVKKSGHWKNAARGNPRKGYESARKALSG
jgi:hypothetical protein